MKLIVKYVVKLQKPNWRHKWVNKSLFTTNFSRVNYLGALNARGCTITKQFVIARNLISFQTFCSV